MEIKVVNVKRPQNPCCKNMGDAWGQVVYSAGNQLLWIGGVKAVAINACPFCKEPVDGVEDTTALAQEPGQDAKPLPMR